MMRHGVQIARRGWIEKKDVINALSIDELLATLRAKPGASSQGKQEAAAASITRERPKSRKSS